METGGFHCLWIFEIYYLSEINICDFIISQTNFVRDFVVNNFGEWSNMWIFANS